MLFLLHTLSAVWFAMILKVVTGVLCGKSAEDIRSEDESEQPKDFSNDDMNYVPELVSSSSVRSGDLHGGIKGRAQHRNSRPNKSNWK